MNKSYADITGAELLRADVKSQQISVKSDDEKGETFKEKELVTIEQFWGNGTGSGLYFDYMDNTNKGWTVEKSGWNDFSLDLTAHMDPQETNDWIQQKVFCPNESSLTVIQGYAGCGKTIFVNSLLRQFAADDIFSAKQNDVYVDYDNNASENGYLVNSLCNKISAIFVQIMADSDGLSIYKRFVRYANLYSAQSPSFREVLPLFRADGLITNYLNQLHECRGNPKDFANAKDMFNLQFICGTISLGREKRRDFTKKHINILSLKEIDDECIALLLEDYLAMYFLLLHACDTTRNSRPTIVLFDNLDIIDNPHHIALLIFKLQHIIFRIKNSLKGDDRPVINVIITVRKISYAIINHFFEVEGSARGNYFPARFLDISNLYSATQILKHKAKILKEHLNDYIPENARKKDIKSFLESVINSPDDVLDAISISALFNHNIRACANVLEHAEKYSSKKEITIDKSKLSKQCIYTIWLHNICAVLHQNEIWSNLNFATNNNDLACFPASFSRLILTILYNKRKDYIHHRNNVTDVEATLKEIYEQMEGLPNIICNKWIKLQKKATDAVQAYNKEGNLQESIVNSIAQMLKRNALSTGSDSEYEEELWRRPLYFTQNAFPLVDINGQEIIKEGLSSQLSLLKTDQNIKTTAFCITDEGYTFIEKIVTSYEFFSVRVNGLNALPLCYITDPILLDKTIKNVYALVESTINDHRWLMSFYLAKRKSSSSQALYDRQREINEYLVKSIHPRTEGNHPQLHGVRTIFDHIYALNYYRDSLIEIRPSNLRELNKCLVKWIGMYLELYRSKYYRLLDGTIGSYNNVFLDLKFLYWLVYKDEDYLPTDNSGHISIARNNTSYERKRNRIICPDNTLLSNKMIIKDDYS